MNEIDVVIKLIVAALFGGLVGYVREIEGKAAGLRTHLLVCTGATLIMLISIFMGEKFNSVDASRIAANVVAGIGFLGAGAIIRDRGTVRGLTTAASIWIVSAIGLAVGCGYYLGATIATLITLIALQILGKIEHKYIKGKKEEEE